MEKIHVESASKEDLKIIFNELKPWLLNKDPDTGSDLEKKRNRKDVLKDLNFSINDWNRLSNGEPKISTYKRKIKTILLKYKLVPYRRSNGDLFLERGNPKLSKIIKNWGPDFEGVFFYSYYYVSNDSNQKEGSPIEKALLVINYKISEASLFFFTEKKLRKGQTKQDIEKIIDFNHPIRSAENLEPLISTRYSGTIKLEGTQFYIHLNQRVAYIEKVGIEQPDLHQGMIVLRILEGNQNLLNLTVGNYAGKGPTGGICVIENINRQKIFNLPFNTNLKPKIHFLLSGRSFSWYTNQDLYEISNSPMFKNTIDLYAKNYIGYRISRIHGKSNLSKFILKIDDFGIMTLNPNNENNLLRGQSRILQEKSNFEINGSPPIIFCELFPKNKSKTVRSFIMLQATQKIKENNRKNLGEYYGGYFELSNEENHFNSGLFTLTPASEMDIDNFNSKESHIELDYENLIAENIYLLPFFLGYVGSFGDYIFPKNFFLLERFLFSFNRAHRKGQNIFFNGTYRLFYPSSNGDVVYGKIVYISLSIDPAINKVTWIDEYDSNRDIVIDKYLGSFSIANKYLTLKLNERHFSNGDGDTQVTISDRLLIFRIGVMNKEFANHSFFLGKIHRQNRDEKQIMSNALIEKLSSQEDLKDIGSYFIEYQKDDLVKKFPDSNEIHQLFK